MSAPVWITAAGDLGIIPEEEYYEFFFDAYIPGGGTVTYRVISGQLPRGLDVKNNGRLLGIPSGEVAGVPMAVNKVTTSTFTVRAQNSLGQVADRTFSLTVAGILPQIITPAASNLGTFIDGTYVEIDINTIEPNPLLTSKFSIIGGEFPQGLTLNETTGIISGYLTPFQSAQSASNTGFDVASFDDYGFQFSGVDTSKNFQFTIEADNGVTIETKIYTIYVVALSGLTADNDIIKADGVGKITADTSAPNHLPVLITEEGSLGNIRQNTRVDIQLIGKDFDGDDIYFYLDPTSDSLPPGLSLNATSGWITGVVPYGALSGDTYTFKVRVAKTLTPEYRSNAKTYSLTILGQINDTVTWLTPSNLGTLNTGEISELFVAATTPNRRQLNYKLVDSTGRLPIGLELTADGLLAGRISFETFMLDSGYTTFDENSTVTDLTTFDQKYTFTIATYDNSNYVYDTRTFTVSVIKRDIKPYENLYIQALPSKAQRLIYEDVVNNEDYIPVEFLYRANDPWFGRNSLRRSLFLTGLNPAEASKYISSMALNHYWKTLNFGEIKSAIATDSNFNIKYEVVYVELLDRELNSKGLGPNLAVSLPANSANISTIYPNSFTNMVNRVSTGVGYENKGILPDWMTSRQQDGTVLGFTRALVLCYTIPGKGREIAYRIRQVQDKFKLIDFTIDRYEWDNSLGDNYNKAGNVFLVNNFTTGSGTISSNISSNVITGLTLIVNGSGTISGTVGSAEITGNSSFFGSELTIGRPLYRNDTGQELGIIRSIRSTTNLVLENPLSATISNLAYSAVVSSTSFTSEIYVGDTIVVPGGTRLGTVKSIENDGNLTLFTNAATTVSNVTYQHNKRDTFRAPGKGDKYLKYPQVGVIS